MLQGATVRQQALIIAAEVTIYRGQPCGGVVCKASGYRKALNNLRDAPALASPIGKFRKVAAESCHGVAPFSQPHAPYSSERTSTATYRPCVSFASKQSYNSGTASIGALLCLDNPVLDPSTAKVSREIPRAHNSTIKGKVN